MKKILVSMLAVATFAACSHDSEVVNIPQGDTPMEFGTGIAVTRVAADATTFEDEDLIKVVGFVAAAAPTAYTDALFAENFKYNLTETKFASDASPSAAYWQLLGKHHFYAYYPNTVAVPAADGTDVTLPAPAATGMASEVLWANVEDITFNGQDGFTKPALTFARKLAKVRFRVQFDDGYSDATLKLNKISFTATKQGAATMNLFTGVVTPVTGNVTFAPAAGDEAIAAYAAAPAKDATDYNALAWAPMLYATTDAVSAMTVTINNQDIPVSGLTGFTVAEGQITYVLLTVKRTGIEFTATINAWTEGAGGSGDVQ